MESKAVKENKEAKEEALKGVVKANDLSDEDIKNVTGGFGPTQNGNMTCL